MARIYTPLDRAHMERAVKDMAKLRGELYLAEALKYEALADFSNAQAAAIEGLRLCMGPFYLACRDQLQDLLERIKPWNIYVMQPWGACIVAVANA